MTPQCSREIIQGKFKVWLSENHSSEVLQTLDLHLETQKWVAEQGDMTGAGFGLLLLCGHCGQRTMAQPDGNFSMLDSDNACLVSEEPVVPVHEFNK